jgi:hypothetical protein
MFLCPQKRERESQEVPEENQRERGKKLPLPPNSSPGTVQPRGRQPIPGTLELLVDTRITNARESLDVFMAGCLRLLGILWDTASTGIRHGHAYGFSKGLRALLRACSWAFAFIALLVGLIK